MNQRRKVNNKIACSCMLSYKPYVSHFETSEKLCALRCPNKWSSCRLTLSVNLIECLNTEHQRRPMNWAPITPCPRRINVVRIHMHQALDLYSKTGGSRWCITQATRKLGGGLELVITSLPVNGSVGSIGHHSKRRWIRPWDSL